MADIDYSKFTADQIGNHFSISLFGHSQDIKQYDSGAEEEDIETITLTESEVYLNSLKVNFDNNENENTLYDSFYVPADCRLRSITIKLIEALPLETSMKVTVKINGAAIEVLPILEEKNFNRVLYSTGDCEIPVWEDDFVQIEVDIVGKEKLDTRLHNIIVGIGCSAIYEEYKEIIDGSFEVKERYYKTNLTIHNRSGYDRLRNKYILARIKSPIEFYLQSIKFSCIEDFLMEPDKKIKRSYSCFYIDLLLNGISLNRVLKIQQPIPLDSVNGSLREYESGINTGTSGIRIMYNDDVSLKLYIPNINGSYNGRIFEAILIGCSVSSVNEIIETITVLEPCLDESCVPKFPPDATCENK
jgi:hypothetical protein